MGLLESVTTAYEWYFKKKYITSNEEDTLFIREFVLDNYDRYLKGKPCNDSRLNEYIKHHRSSDIILYVRNPSEGSIICALKQYPDLIFKLTDVEITDDMRITCVAGDGEFIQHFDNPSMDVQKVAVRQNPYAIEFIKNPSQEILDLALSITPKVGKLIPGYIIDGQQTISREILTIQNGGE
jgi:hypothetical protein